MTPLFIITALLIALGSGFLGALLGLGGGVIMVPLLVFGLDIPIQIASGASIVAVVATSSISASVYVQDKITNMRLGMFLEMATTLGAVTGASLMMGIGENILEIILGASLLYAAFVMWHQMKNTSLSWIPKENDWIANKLKLGTNYYDPALNRTITYGVSRSFPTFILSYIAGIVSGLLGIGGGGMKVPAMNVISSVPMKAAVATSNFMIGVTAAASAIVYIRNGFCDGFVTAPVVLGTLAGSYIGASVALQVKGVMLKKIFIIILLILGFRMLISGMGIL
jgi:uncharacterized membrane protein YfcA